VLVLAAIWTVQEQWDVSASSLNVIYETPYTYSVLADDRLLTDTGFVSLLGDTIEVRRVIVSGDSIVFLTSNMDNPVIIYSRTESTMVRLPLRGAFVDYDPVAGILISPMALRGSQSYSIEMGFHPLDIYGFRVVSFADSVLYLDRYGNLRFLSGRILLGGVKDVLPYDRYLLVLGSGNTLLMDEDFQVRKSIPRDFHLASGFYWMGSNGNFLLASGSGIYLWELRTGSFNSLFRTSDSITCISPVDYDGDGGMDVLVSTTSGLFLYSNPTASAGEEMEKVMVDEYGYPSTCGGLYGMKFMKRTSKSGMVKLETRYMPDGWRISFDAPEGERVRVRVVNSRGITVFSKEMKTGRGRSVVEVRDGFKAGTYTIIVEGETFRGRRTVIWKGR